MIVTPEHLIKKYFPRPVDTTRELYDRLGLKEVGYSYLNWLNDAEKHCLTRYMDESDYRLLDDDERNFWISEKAFKTLLQASPSKISDEIRACYSEISRKVASDPVFARKLQDQIDREAGLETIVPKVSKKLKSAYNETGQDAFEFSVKSDNRLYMDIISAYDFQPGQTINEVSFTLKLEIENGVPFHLILLTLSLNNGHVLSYRTIWACSDERQKYGAILKNGMIRINLFEDNKKLVDSCDYLFYPNELQALEAELEKIIRMLMEIKIEEFDAEQLGIDILMRHNKNDQAYASAISSIIQLLKNNKKGDALEAAFIEAINRYWECYVVQDDPSRSVSDDLDQMIKDRIPRVALAFAAADILSNADLCQKYFKRRYSDNQKQVLLSDGNIRLIFALSEANGFDPNADPSKRTDDMCAFLSKYYDSIQTALGEAGSQAG